MERLVVGVAALLLGCGPDDPDLGVCDVELAYRVVYQAPLGSTHASPDLVPMYEGQALTTQYCSASECHRSDRAFYDLTPTCPVGCCTDRECRRSAVRACGEATDSSCIEDFVTRGRNARHVEQVRLRENQELVYEHRRAIWRTVARGSMPREGATRESTLFAELDDLELGAEVPDLDSEASREALRNWLACGSPLVELVEPVGVRSYASSCGEGTVGECVPVPYAPGAPEPTWFSIHSEVVAPFCSQCHQCAECGSRCGCAELQLGSRAEAYALLRTEQSQADCGDAGALLTPGSPTESRFYTSLTMGCDYHRGWRLPDHVVEPIQAWIEAGANP